MTYIKSLHRRPGTKHEMSQQQLQLQMYMDRASKADAVASNTMKKWSQLSSQINNNMK